MNLFSLFFSQCQKSNKPQSTIASFDPIQNTWTKLGDLKVARAGHGTIQVENEVVVLGGGGTVPTESCNLNEQLTTCSTRDPELTNFYKYPVLMLFPE